MILCVHSAGRQSSALIGSTRRPSCETLALERDWSAARPSRKTHLVNPHSPGSFRKSFVFFYVFFCFMVSSTRHFLIFLLNDTLRPLCRTPVERSDWFDSASILWDARARTWLVGGASISWDAPRFSWLLKRERERERTFRARFVSYFWRTFAHNCRYRFQRPMKRGNELSRRAS